METLTFGPLVAVIQTKRDWCNQIFEACSVRYPTLDPVRVKAALCRIVEPLMNELYTRYGPAALDLFDLIYETIIELEGAGYLRTLEAYYVSVLRLVTRIPLDHPAQGANLIRSFIRAAQTLAATNVDSAAAWAQTLHQALIFCHGQEDALNAGRVCAWKKGSAQWRLKALDVMESLPPKVLEVIFETPLKPTTIARLKRDPWYDPLAKASGPQKRKGHFRYLAGGFRGWEGPFTSPPLVANLDGQFMACDKRVVCALFADAFGAVTLNHIPLSPSDVRENAASKIKGVKSPTVASITDIRSMAADTDTLVLTRESSHYLYVFKRHATK